MNDRLTDSVDETGYSAREIREAVDVLDAAPILAGSDSEGRALRTARAVMLRWAAQVDEPTPGAAAFHATEWPDRGLDWHELSDESKQKWETVAAAAIEHHARSSNAEYTRTL